LANDRRKMPAPEPMNRPPSARLQAKAFGHGHGSSGRAPAGNRTGSPVPDAGGRLIDQRLALAAVFGRPLQNFQEIVHCFPIATRFPDRIDSLLQMRSESGTHHTLATR